MMLYNVDGEVYCSDANSTAYKYPLTHAKIIEGASLSFAVTFLKRRLASCGLAAFSMTQQDAIRKAISS